jgi:branched-chain amino acid transport system permease protein
MSAYLLPIMILIEIYVILSLGLQIVLGWGGLFNLAHVAMFGVGAYVVATLTTAMDVNPWIALMLAPVVAALAMYPVYLISLRLRGDSFALGSLALSLCIVSIFINWSSVTHGVLGIAGIPRVTLFGISTDSNELFFVVLTIATLCFLGVSLMLHAAPFGKFLYAQSEFEQAVDALGVSAAKMRSVACMLGAIYAGSAGGFFAMYLSFIDPTSFSLSEMIFILSIVILAGLYSVWSVLVSTTFLVVLPEVLRFADMPSSILGPGRQFLYAITLYLAVLVRGKKIFIARREV